MIHEIIGYSALGLLCIGMAASFGKDIEKQNGESGTDLIALVFFVAALIVYAITRP